MSQDVSKTKTAGRAKKTKPEDKAKFKKALGSELASRSKLRLGCTMASGYVYTRIPGGAYQYRKSRRSRP